MSQLASFAQSNKDSRYARYAWVMQSFMDEILDELDDTEMNDEKMASFFVQFGHVIEWCGSGDGSVLPESVRAFLLHQEPALLAIEAPVSVEA